jgi:hypothetical protein
LSPRGSGSPTDAEREESTVAFCTLLEFEDLDLDRYAEMAARGSHDGLPDEFEMPAPTRVAAFETTIYESRGS